VGKGEHCDRMGWGKKEVSSESSFQKKDEKLILQARLVTAKKTAFGIGDLEGSLVANNRRGRSTETRYLGMANRQRGGTAKLEWGAVWGRDGDSGGSYGGVGRLQVHIHRVEKGNGTKVKVGRRCERKKYPPRGTNLKEPEAI